MRKKILCVILSIILTIGGLCVSACSSSFTVTFDLNGGYLVNDVKLVQTVNSASQIEVPVVEKEGYAFVGWDTIIDKVSTTTTIKALWSLKKYKITFMSNGGTLKSGEEEQRVVSGREIVPPVYEKTGYTLSWDKDFSTITESTVINAVWIPKTYDLTFDANGGYFADGYDGQTPVQVKYNEKITYFPKVENKDLTVSFNGWIIVDNSIGKPNDGKKVYESSVWKYDSGYLLKATWGPNGVKSISYDLDGGDFENDTGVDYFVPTDPDFELENPIRVGYTFIGWTGEGIETPQLIVTIKTGTDRDLFFTANWEKRTYAVQLDSQGGELSQTKISIQYGQQVGTLLPEPSKEGYVFSHWAFGNYSFNTNNAPSVVWLIDQNVTLKAIYKRILTVNYNLTYVENGVSGYSGVPATVGGKSQVNSRTIVEEEKMIDALVGLETPETILSEAYQFSCWVCVVKGTEYVIDENLIAKEKLSDNGKLTIMPKFTIKSSYTGFVLKFNVDVKTKDDDGKSVTVKMDYGKPVYNALVADGQKINDALKGFNPTANHEDFFFDRWVYVYTSRNYTITENTVASSSIAKNKVITVVALPKCYWNGPY